MSRKKKISKKPLKGKLSLYFATGEEPRPQFIADSALDEEGRIVNYHGIYDIKEGDSVVIRSENFKNNCFTITPGSHTFLFYLSAMYQECELRLEYIPSMANKSWGEINDEHRQQSLRLDK